MRIQNIATKKEYTMTRESYEGLGKNKKLFRVLDETDTIEEPQIIDNIAKPKTGEAKKDNKAEDDKAAKNTQSNTRKSKNNKNNHEA
jgi:hypothetical protein